MATDSNFLFNLNTFTSSSTTSSLISTINSCSSNTSSNSSSFIQLTNDLDTDSPHQHQQSRVSNTPTSTSTGSSTTSTTTTTSLTNKSKFILNAYVNGFVQLKLCADKIDYEYIIEIYWSNNLKTFIKRTYDDFILFHRKLANEFCLLNGASPNGSGCLTNASQSVQNSNKNTPNTNKLKQFILNSNFIDKSTNTSNNDKDIPTLSGKKPFWMNRLKLAEVRESELNSYVQRLIKLPIQISHSAAVLEFFETQTSDPKPANINYYDSNPANTIEHGNGYDDDLNDYENYDQRRQQQQQQQQAKYSLRRRNTHDDEDEDDDDECDADEAGHTNLSGNNNSNASGTNDDGEGALWWDEDSALNELTCSIHNDSVLNVDFLYETNDHLLHAADSHATSTHEQFESLEKILNNNFRNGFLNKVEEN